MSFGERLIRRFDWVLGDDEIRFLFTMIAIELMRWLPCRNCHDQGIKLR